MKNHNIETHIFIVRDRNGKYLNYFDAENQSWYFPNTSNKDNIPDYWEAKYIIPFENYSYEHGEKRSYIGYFYEISFDEFVENMDKIGCLYSRRDWFSGYDLEKSEIYDKNFDVINVVLHRKTS